MLILGDAFVPKVVSGDLNLIPKETGIYYNSSSVQLAQMTNKPSGSSDNEMVLVSLGHNYGVQLYFDTALKIFIRYFGSGYGSWQKVYPTT